MSTHCLIAQKVNGKYNTILCQHDGYQEGVGKVLGRFYKKEEKVAKMIAKGDLNSIGNTLKSCEHFNDEFSKTKTFSTLNQLLAQAKKDFCGFVYIFENGNWYCIHKASKALM